MGSSCKRPAQPVPTTVAEAAEGFMCRAHLCRLSGDACARRYRREEAKRRSRRDIGCDGCEAGKARAELLGVEPVLVEWDAPPPGVPGPSPVLPVRRCEPVEALRLGCLPAVLDDVRGVG